MAFNAMTYRANKHRKAAWANLAKAKELKKRVAAGTAYDWELPRIKFFVQMARSDMRLHLINKELRGLSL